ncbi:hypothetical protein [Streptomyces levis]
MAVSYRTNLTMRQLAPLLGVGLAGHRVPVTQRLVPLLALELVGTSSRN